MTVRIINKSKHPLPAYATELSAGMDIRANLSEPMALEPLQRCLVPTGLYIALPAGFEAQIRPRSGLAIKKGISRHEQAVWQEVDVLDETERGAGGFGHTGV